MNKNYFNYCIHNIIIKQKEKDMLSNDILVELISKIRDSPFLKKYSNILERTPSINVNFVEDKGIELYNICFNDWDEIRISNTEIVFYPEHSASWPPPREVILSYENWEELCAILRIYDKDK